MDVESTSIVGKNGELLFTTQKENESLLGLREIVLKNIDAYMSGAMDDVYIYERFTDRPTLYVFYPIAEEFSYFLVVEVNFNRVELLLNNLEDEILGEKSIMLLDSRSRVLFSTNEADVGESFAQGDIDQISQKKQYQDTKGDEVIAAYDTVFKFGQNEAIGWRVLASIPLKSIDDKVFDTLALNLQIGLAIALLTLIILALVAKSVSRSTNILLRFAKRVNRGDYSARMDSRNTILEFEELTKILNEMSQTIEKRNSELEDKNRLFMHLAQYDVLTAIPNRMLFQDRLEHAIQKSHRNKTSVALLFLDLDQFKHINDSYGHDYGDEVLKECAIRLKSVVRQEDTVARIGGDEFTIILEGIKSPKVIHTIAANIIELIKTPVIIEDQRFLVSCSIGVSIYPQDASDKGELIKYADTAMYKAKAQGRNQYQFYSSELTKMSLERIELEKRLYDALEKRELVLYYQPQIDLKSQRVVGCEALLRWQRGDGTVVSPAHFLPLAQEIGMIVLIDKWVLESAMKQAVAWTEAGLASQK